MPDVLVDLEPTVPSIYIPSMSDDECLARLVEVIADQDSDSLDEVARLIGRLAVTIE
jgi:predicted transcriptional regulator